MHKSLLWDRERLHQESSIAKHGAPGDDIAHRQISRRNAICMEMLSLKVSGVETCTRFIHQLKITVHQQWEICAAGRFQALEQLQRAIGGAVVTHQQALGPECLPVNRSHLLYEVSSTVVGRENNLDHQSTQPHLRK